MPIPKPGLINEVLIDFRTIADNLIKARSIDWVLALPLPIPGPREHARDAAVAHALHIVKSLEKKIEKAFADLDVTELQEVRQNFFFCYPPR